MNRVYIVIVILLLYWLSYLEAVREMKRFIITGGWLLQLLTTISDAGELVFCMCYKVVFVSRRLCLFLCLVRQPSLTRRLASSIATNVIIIFFVQIQPILASMAYQTLSS